MNPLLFEIVKDRRPVQSLFVPFQEERGSFLLESTQNICGMGRYSFFGSSPFCVVEARGKKCVIREGGTSRVVLGASLETLRGLLDAYRLAAPPKMTWPFLGGAVGFFSYDFGLDIEGVRRSHQASDSLPDWMFAFYDVVVGVDRKTGEVAVFSSGFPERGAAGRLKARLKLQETLNKLKKIFSACLPAVPSGPLHRGETFTSNFSKKEYMAAVTRAKEHIAAGDIYQINLSQKMCARARLDDWALYQRLSRSFPVSFAAFLKTKDFSIVSASPERFLSFDGRRVKTRPMKGTARRTGNLRFDEKMKEALWESRKEKAELLMVVDLERNDLGRVCDYGTIRLRRRRGIERYRSVFQATAEIEGVLHKDRDRLDLIRACFPGGSVTGCPKIRAMQIIEELEPDARGIYTGALGYLSFHNTLELNVLIRSFLKKKDEICFSVGGGIVSDSKPEAEYEETLIKAQSLLEAAGISEEQREEG